MNTIIIGIRVGHVGIHYNETGVHLVIFHLVFSSFFFSFFIQRGRQRRDNDSSKTTRKNSLFSNENKPFFCNTIVRHLAREHER